mgnify:CR=1 FL=1
MNHGEEIISSADTENIRLSAEAVRSGLDSTDTERKIIVLDETDSTNNEAKKLAAEGVPHGTVVIADSQTAGRGRLDRQFVSPAGKGLYMSIIIRPESDIKFAPMITSAAAVAAAIAVENICGSEVQIKWVNDLYMNGKKICGILTEAAVNTDGKSLEYVIVGIGINVRSISDELEDELKLRASSIEDETGKILDRNVLCAAVLNELDTWLGKIEDRSYITEYRQREFLTGKRIIAESGGKIITGTAVGIDRNANLMVELPNGDIINLNSGEANLLKK